MNVLLYLHIVVLDPRLPDHGLELDELDGAVHVPVGEVERLDAARGVGRHAAQHLRHDADLVTGQPRLRPRRRVTQRGLGARVLGLGQLVQGVDRVGDLLLERVVAGTKVVSILGSAAACHRGGLAAGRGAGLVTLEPARRARHARGQDQGILAHVALARGHVALALPGRQRDGVAGVGGGLPVRSQARGRGPAVGEHAGGGGQGQPVRGRGRGHARH